MKKDMSKLSIEMIEKLKKQHRREKSRDVCDRIKAVLLRDKGWSEEKICEALLVHEDTVKRHLKDYDEQEGKLKSVAGGSQSKLSQEISCKLQAHLEEHTYVKVQDICEYVRITYGIHYTVPGMTSWLRAHRFSYKKPKTTPFKADPEKQAAFIEYYEKLKFTRPESEPILFMDSVHPTMATKVSYGWIRTGKDKFIGTIASRTRINITGALDLESMKVEKNTYETINAKSIVNFFSQVRKAYPDHVKIHIILDQAGYHKSEEVTAFAQKNNISLHYLPPYSPNLNSIERLWKVMHEVARNNVVFKTPQEFRERIDRFFDVDYPAMASSLVDRITDNFRVAQKAFSF